MTSFPTKSWSAGLIKEISNSKNHIISSHNGVVIKDKYPKSQHHYLVLPKEDISSVFQLTQSHLNILEELHLLGLNIIEIRGLQANDFKLGFHAQPSMQHLHLHVISKDFVSKCLKTKKHWNSFNTKLFLPFDVAVKELTENGCIKRLEGSELNKLLNTELRCNQCDYVATNIPQLKDHLLEHWLKISHKEEEYAK